MTNPAYFVRHLASPVVSFWGHVIFPNITLFIYKPQTHVWFAYTDEWWNYQTNMLSTVNCTVNQRHHLETYTFPISSRKNTNSIEFFLCITIYIDYQTLLLFFFPDQIRVITKLPNSEQSYKGKVKHKLIFSLQLIIVYCFHIHFGYVLYINLAQNRGWKMSIILFQNVQW